ncbi:MAG: hypothetical protein AAB679_01745 [Patescibacteria group bacterium]
MKYQYVFYPGEITINLQKVPNKLPQKDGYTFENNFFGIGTAEDFYNLGVTKVKLMQIPAIFNKTYCGELLYDKRILPKEIRKSFLGYSHMTSIIADQCRLGIPDDWKKNGLEITFLSSVWRFENKKPPTIFFACSMKFVDGRFREINKPSDEEAKIGDCLIAVSYQKFLEAEKKTSETGLYSFAV